MAFKLSQNCKESEEKTPSAKLACSHYFALEQPNSICPSKRQTRLIRLKSAMIFTQSVALNRHRVPISVELIRTESLLTIIEKRNVFEKALFSMFPEMWHRIQPK